MIVAVGFNPRMGTTRNITSRSDRLTPFTIPHLGRLAAILHRSSSASGGSAALAAQHQGKATEAEQGG